jgi:predicted nucleotidyltransferase
MNCSIFETMNKRETILSLVENKVREIDPEIQIILFGSRARNEASSHSDWDFLFLTKRKVNRDFRNSIYDKLYETELETDEILTGVVQNFNTWKEYSSSPFFKNIVKDGVIL